jgi:hypothetical protein
MNQGIVAAGVELIQRPNQVALFYADLYDGGTGKRIYINQKVFAFRHQVTDNLVTAKPVTMITSNSSNF